MDRSLVGQDPLQSTSSWDVPEQPSTEVADSAAGLQTLAMQVLAAEIQFYHSLSSCGNT